MSLFIVHSLHMTYMETRLGSCAMCVLSTLAWSETLMLDAWCTAGVTSKVAALIFEFVYTASWFR